MKKQKRQLLILLALLAVCIAGYFAAGAFAEQKEAEEAQAEEEYVALRFDSSEVVRLEINGSAGQLLLDYDGGSWSFVNDIAAEMAAMNGTETAEETESETDGSAAEDETAETDEAASDEAAQEDAEEEDTAQEAGAEYEVNQTTANTILGYLEELTSEYEIIPQEELSAYGFDAPSMTVTITMEDGTGYSVVLGDYNEMLGGYYFYVDEAGTLYSLGTYTYNILNKCDTDLADEIEEEEAEEEETGKDGAEEEEAETGEDETGEGAGEE